MSTVGITSCEQYENEAVLEAMRDLMAKLGGMEQFVRRGQRVTVKPNLVQKRRPNDAATTHPAVVRAVCILAMEAGGIITIAESPGGAYNKTVLKGLYDACGMTEIARELGVKLNEDVSFQSVPFEAGRAVKGFEIIRPILDADVVISVSKLKTHVMSYMTGAVKNLFGCVPGTYKAEYHFRMPDKKQFCNMLVDLCECIKPTLSIVDAVECMEGDGPTSGTPRHVGYLLGGADPYALDTVACNMVGLDTKAVYILQNAWERRLSNPETIRELGQYVPICDFKAPGTKDIHFVKNPLLKKMAEKLVSPKPVADANKCVGCGQCMRCCPAKVIQMEDNLPKIDYAKCLKCFCCHELCPIQAMDLKRNKIWNMILKV